MTVPRWLLELLSPKLKCQRVGHRPAILYRSGYRLKCQYSGRTCVADTVEQTSTLCSRCHIELVPWLDLSVSCLQGLTLNTSRYRQLNRDGVLWS